MFVHLRSIGIDERDLELGNQATSILPTQRRIRTRSLSVSSQIIALGYHGQVETPVNQALVYFDQNVVSHSNTEFLTAAALAALLCMIPDAK